MLNLFGRAFTVGWAPADPSELNQPAHEPLVNGKVVTIEVISVNGHRAPGRSLEKAVQGFSKYVAGEVRTVRGEPAELETDENGRLVQSQLGPIIAGRCYSGPSDIAILLVPGLSDFQHRCCCMPQPDGSHVIVIGAKWPRRGTPDRKTGWRTVGRLLLLPVAILLAGMVPRQKLWYLLVKHELFHALGLPCDSSHAWAEHHCTNPGCLLYGRVDAQAVLRTIVRLGPPLDLCCVCQREIRRVQEAAGGRLIGPAEPYEDMKRLEVLVLLNPTHPLAYAYRAQGHWQRGNYHSAIDDLTKAVELGPGAKTAACYRNRGILHTRVGEFKRAIGDWERCLRLEADDTRAVNNLAWVLATAPDDAIRDGSRAIELAKRACRLSNWKGPHELATLAAAYAETGKFERAIEYQTKAVLIANTEEKQEYREGLGLYQAGRPFRNG